MKQMRSMALFDPAPAEDRPLRLLDLPLPTPGTNDVLVRIEVCGVCRTDLHILEGDLPPQQSPLIPGHQVVGVVASRGKDVRGLKEGDRVGVAWLYSSCMKCRYCGRGQENLCTRPQFTGYTQNGGYGEYIIAPAEYIYPIPTSMSAASAAPLLCAGIIGYRALTQSGIKRNGTLALYGFGASAHIVLQIAAHWECEVYVVSRSLNHRGLAHKLGAAWVGDISQTLPRPPDASIIFAPSGDLVPPALQALDRGGTLVLAGVHMSAIPSLNYEQTIFYERTLKSVTANTRKDGHSLLHLAEQIPLVTHTQEFSLGDANQALLQLKTGGISGSAVLRISDH